MAFTARPRTQSAVTHIHHINLQRAVGGGEIYTRWFTRALAQAGASVTLYVHRESNFWAGLEGDRIRVLGVDGAEDIARHLPGRQALILTQSRIPERLAELAARDHVLTGFSHMPMLGRSPVGFGRYAVVFTVSKYCIGLLRKAGIAQVYPEPMYGTYSLDRTSPHVGNDPIRATSPYHWDQRKARDRLLSLLEPVALALRPRREFERRPGLTLGILSLLSPIKQFPELFNRIVPHLAKVPQVNLEVFGDGGYAQVRDIRKALAPIRDRVRFWGYQSAVHRIYPQIDYLMTGLPEKEALGLNALEAQAQGTPVLAPDAPPFTETILHGKSGFLYRDPRTDGGRDFGLLLESLVSGHVRPNPLSAGEHLAKFSFEAMVQRTRTMLDAVGKQFPETCG